MNKLNNFLTSTLGRKLIVALTGLFLISFLIVHVSGNMLLFSDDGGEAFNIYSRFMSTNTIIRILEIGLLLGFVIHIYVSLVLTSKNRSARDVNYVKKRSHENSTWYSRNMALFGII
ncbi:MAG: succinate dehydrogenase, partial [Bacteroidia bacterium]|nr:succinate dehydrogenase [Bacteroidia bacterium]